MAGSPKDQEGAGSPASVAPLTSALSGLADEHAGLAALGARAGAAAVAALDGFATGDALGAALARWRCRTETVERALGEAATALGDGRPGPAG
ncbi:hypothetical protein [Kitasatospora sp. NPDC091207]|uniref:hypothetical protein n=1 Tax=Kitasatospora sp. NPDC091207 TaxID=3364083 RepID=UPI0037F51629